MDDKALDAITEPKDHRVEIGRSPKGDNTGGYVDIERMLVFISCSIGYNRVETTTMNALESAKEIYQMSPGMEH